MYKVVLVDDEAWTLKRLNIIFPWSEYGFEVIDTFNDARLALDMIVTKKPDLVLTDVRMPEYSGLDLVRIARENNCKTKFVMVSGYADFQYAQEAIRYGVTDYLLKPVSRETADKTLARIKKDLDELRGASSESVFDNAAFNEMIHYINEHYREKLQLGELSKRFNLNRTYCSELFKKNMGISFVEYLTKLRMKAAADMIVKGISVQEIAQKMDYDYTHFNKVFKKYYNLTPRQYKQKCEDEDAQ